MLPIYSLYDLLYQAVTLLDRFSQQRSSALYGQWILFPRSHCTVLPYISLLVLLR